MATFRKESLEALRQRVELVDVLKPYVELKPSGAAYKGLCPFHEEKTPSFMVQRGDNHYHCFGCGAHGDAISFLMQHLQMKFHESVEVLAQQFGVHLEYLEGGLEDTDRQKKGCYHALEEASKFYHHYLLHTEEGHKALHYLYERGIDLPFIRKFQIGYASQSQGMFYKAMKQKGIDDSFLLEAGLIKTNDREQMRDFFYDRITFPIHHPSGSVIGFSARKHKESTFGGKYVNTSETLVFKKSKVLFGLNYSRRRIAKERKAIVVEGQIDALRLIHEGLDYTVASQGTAFGEHQVKELLRLGVTHIYLAFDADHAGIDAAVKVGDLFQKEGVEVSIVHMPPGSDPDQFVRENGPQLFHGLLQGGIDYLTFLVRHHSDQIDLSSPAKKNDLVQSLATQIRAWKNEVMVHESLLKLARLAQVPEYILHIDAGRGNLYTQKFASAHPAIQDELNPTRILEMDFLRWLILDPHQLASIAQKYLRSEDLQDESCRAIYDAFVETFKRNSHVDLLTLLSVVQDKEQEVLSSLLEKKIDLSKAKEHFLHTVQKILDKIWMEKRERVRMKIQSGDASDDGILELCKEFDALKNNRPVVQG